VDLLPLAPHNLDRLKVSPCVPVPALPQGERPAFDFRGFPRSLSGATLRFPKLFLQATDSGAWVIMDKLNTHSLYDLTLMQAGQCARTTLLDLTPDEFSLFQEVTRLFGTFVSQADTIRGFELEGGIPRVVFNHDPATWDRPGLQAVDRFHTHMYILTQSTRDTIMMNEQSYAGLESRLVRRRLVDPVSFIAPRLLFDLFVSSKCVPDMVRLVYPDPVAAVRDGLPIGLNLFIDAGWPVVGDKWFGDFLRTMHLQMLKASDEIAHSFTGRSAIAPSGTRFSLLPRQEIRDRIQRIGWLSEESRVGLQELAACLRNAPERLLRNSRRHQSLSVHTVVLNGLAYTLSLTSSRPLARQCSEYMLQLTITVRMFTDIGGASLFGLDGVSVINLERGVGEFSQGEVAQRHAFQEGFLAVVRKEFPREGFISWH